MLEDDRDGPNKPLAAAQRMSAFCDRREDAGESRGMGKEPSRPEGWLLARLEKLGWSMRGFAAMLEERPEQPLRWNSGRYEPPQLVLDWLDEVEAFFLAHPPPRKAEYAALRARDKPLEAPSPFVQRIVDAMRPGETVTIEVLMDRLGASRKSVTNRLSAAGVAGRLGPLRRVGADVYRAKADEIPPGGALDFPEEQDEAPGMTAFASRAVEALAPGEDLDLAVAARRMGVKREALEANLRKALQEGRAGPLDLTKAGTVRRRPEQREAAPVPPAPPPAAPVPVPEPPPITTDEARAALQELGWSQRAFGALLQWRDIREARRWFEGKEVMPPEVANWLRGAVNAKRMAIKAVPAGTPEPSVAAVVGAAIAAALGDPVKVRDAVLAARSSRPRPQASGTAEPRGPHAVEEILPRDYGGPGERRGPVLDLTRRRG